jgi:chromatin remodeling complex protein RSC6
MTAAIKTPKKTTKSASAPGKPVKKVMKSKTTTKPAPVKSAPVVTPEPVQNVEVVPAETTATIEKSMGDVLTGFSESIQTLTLALNKMKTDFKVLEKQVLKEARSMDKVNAKRNKNKGSRAPSGFVKPAGITKELAKFLGVPEDTKIARTDVTKLITSYVKEHNLQDSKNGRKIIPDAKLSALLGVKSSDEVTYFNLQKYMKPHFVKAD